MWKLEYWYKNTKTLSSVKYFEEEHKYHAEKKYYDNSLFFTTKGFKSYCSLNHKWIEILPPNPTIGNYINIGASTIKRLHNLWKSEGGFSPSTRDVMIAIAKDLGIGFPPVYTNQILVEAQNKAHRLECQGASDEDIAREHILGLQHKSVGIMFNNEEDE